MSLCLSGYWVMVAEVSGSLSSPSRKYTVSFSRASDVTCLMILLSRAVEVKMPTSDLCARRKSIVSEQLWLSKWKMTQGAYVCISCGSITDTKKRSLTALAKTAAAVWKAAENKSGVQPFVAFVWCKNVDSENTIGQGPCEPLWWAGHSNRARRGRRWEPSSLWRQQHPPSGYKHPDWKRGNRKQNVKIALL